MMSSKIKFATPSINKTKTPQQKKTVTPVSSQTPKSSNSSVKVTPKSLTKTPVNRMKFSPITPTNQKKSTPKISKTSNKMTPSKNGSNVLVEFGNVFVSNQKTPSVSLSTKVTIDNCHNSKNVMSSKTKTTLRRSKSALHLCKSKNNQQNVQSQQFKKIRRSISDPKLSENSDHSIKANSDDRLYDNDNFNSERSRVTVGVRVRPLQIKEYGSTLITSDKSILIRNEQSGTQHKYNFDYVFTSSGSHSTSQANLYKTMVKPLVDNAFEGYNACLFAYGQTGSGKTHSMMGHDEIEEINGELPSNCGVIPRFCKEVLERCKAVTTTDDEDKENKFPDYKLIKSQVVGATVEISYLEVYNEKIHDLLDQTESNKALRVREHHSYGPYVEDLSKHTVDNFKDIQKLINDGNRRRATAFTDMNNKSSRSHSIFSVILTQNILHYSLDDVENWNNEQTIRSQINLVDLAGSERLANVSNDCRLKEGVSINKSLLTLGIVINSLIQQKNRNCHIPYRDSVLTWLLKDSLGGNSRTSMLATVSPCDSHLDETFATLRYASQARAIINIARINEAPKDKIIRELQAEVSRLRSEALKHTGLSPEVSLTIKSNNIVNFKQTEEELKQLLMAEKQKSDNLLKIIEQGKVKQEIYKEELIKVTDEINELKRININAEKEIINLKVDICDFQGSVKKISELEKAEKKMKDEMFHLKKEIDNNENSKHREDDKNLLEQKNLVDSLRKECCDLKLQRDNQKVDLVKMEIEIKECKIEINDLQKRNNALTDELSKLNLRLKDREEELAEIKTDHTKLERLFKEVNREKEEIDRKLDKFLIEADDKKKKAENVIEKKFEYVEFYKTENSKLTKQVDELTLKIVDSEQKEKVINDMINSNKKLNDQIDELKRLNASNEKTISEFEIKLNECNKKFVDLQQKEFQMMEDFNREINELKLTDNNFQSILEENYKTQRDLNEKLKEANFKLDDYEKILNQTNEEKSRLNDKCLILQMTLDEAEMKYQLQTKESEDLKTMKNDLLNKVDTLEKQLNQSNIKRDIINENYDKVVNELEELKQQFKLSSVNNDRLNMELNEKLFTIAQLRRNSELRQEEFKEMKLLKKENIDLKNKIAYAERINADKINDVDVVKAENCKLKDEMKKLNDNLLMEQQNFKEMEKEFLLTKEKCVTCHKLMKIQENNLEELEMKLKENDNIVLLKENEIRQLMLNINNYEIERIETGHKVFKLEKFKSELFKNIKLEIKNFKENYENLEKSELLNKDFDDFRKELLSLKESFENRSKKKSRFNENDQLRSIENIQKNISELKSMEEQRNRNDQKAATNLKLRNEVTILKEQLTKKTKKVDILSDRINKLEEVMLSTIQETNIRQCQNVVEEEHAKFFRIMMDISYPFHWEYAVRKARNYTRLYKIPYEFDLIDENVACVRHLLYPAKARWFRIQFEQWFQKIEEFSKWDKQMDKDIIWFVDFGDYYEKDEPIINSEIIDKDLKNYKHSKALTIGTCKFHCCNEFLSNFKQPCCHLWEKTIVERHVTGIKEDINALYLYFGVNYNDDLITIFTDLLENLEKLQNTTKIMLNP